MPDAEIFFSIVASAASDFNPNGSETLLANGLSNFFFKGKPIVVNSPINLHRNPLDWPIYAINFFIILY